MRIAIVEDDTRYRESLETLFRYSPGFVLAGSFASAQPMLDSLPDGGTSGRWDLLLMDVGLPDLSGIEATRRVKRLRPEILVVVLTIFEEPAVILDAICAGADGYLLKKTAPRELLTQLKVVAAGGAPLTAGIARSVLELLRTRENAGEAGDAGRNAASGEAGSGGLGLTQRETEVLRCLTRGLAYKQAAAELGISLDTVRFHIRAVYRKLQVHSVAEAVGRAIREKLV